VGPPSVLRPLRESGLHSSLRGNYSIKMQLGDTFTASLRHRFIVIHEHENGTPRISVAANAPAVVAYGLKHHGNYRMIYRNLDGLWHELHHDGEGFLEDVDIAADELEGILEECGLKF
jgi:hypothetical protein